MELLEGKKKFLAAILAACLAFAGLYLDMTPAEIALIVAPLSSYIIAQGMADFGKEAKK